MRRSGGRRSASSATSGGTAAGCTPWRAGERFGLGSGSAAAVSLGAGGAPNRSSMGGVAVKWSGVDVAARPRDRCGGLAGLLQHGLEDRDLVGVEGMCAAGEVDT